ncbi:hypothetical protein ACOSQ2_013072 [Xanthoceras sorbifolium]
MPQSRADRSRNQQLDDTQTRTDRNQPRRRKERNYWEGSPRTLSCPDLFLPISAEEGYGKTREDRTKVYHHRGERVALRMTTFTHCCFREETRGKDN